VIVYQASKSEFLHHALRDDIEDIVSRQFRSVIGHGVARAEIQAWKHSLLEMAKDEQKAVIGARKQRMRDVCKRWFEYGEYIRIEIDVEAGTATVLDRV
jgi:hypothetical protein